MIEKTVVCQSEEYHKLLKEGWKSDYAYQRFNLKKIIGKDGQLKGWNLKPETELFVVMRLE